MLPRSLDREKRTGWTLLLDESIDVMIKNKKEDKKETVP
jgi:hypothetical protein